MYTLRVHGHHLDAVDRRAQRLPAVRVDELAAAEPTRSIKRGTANLCIVDPLARTVGRKEGRWANLLASHPPMEKRVAALRGTAYV